MISVDQGKERIFGVADTNAADFVDKKGGKKIMERPPVNNIFWEFRSPALPHFWYAAKGRREQCGQTTNHL